MIFSRFEIWFICVLASLLFSCKTSDGEDHHDDEDEHGGETAVVLSPEKAREFGVEYEIISPGIFHDVIKTTGEIQPSNGDIYTVTAKKSGIITLNDGISTGAEVNKGEKIVMISAEGLQGGDVAKAAQVNLQAARKEYERLKPLYEEGLVTASTFREAERTYHEAMAMAGNTDNSGSVSLTTPITGNISELLVKSGEYVEVGSPVATIVKGATQILRADVPTKYFSHLKELESANIMPEGGKEILELATMNVRKITGSNPVATNGYLPVYFSFTGNEESFLGGFAEVYLICGPRAGVISVPREALVELQGNKYVYIAIDDDEYEKKLVTTGATDGKRIEIKEGLKEGDRVITKGASVIRMAEISAVAPPSHTHNH
ncbi:MAG: efflux RND transporter periplasmic adaptor subunit [Muribaculaceae bacterium]|nr:efflux RND transporter periplasmic adaptor subunit [Muribaculaceae bacterium]